MFVDNPSQYSPLLKLIVLEHLTIIIESQIMLKNLECSIMKHVLMQNRCDVEMMMNVHKNRIAKTVNVKQLN